MSLEAGAREGEQPALIVERIGAVACLTLNRPGQINAINDAIRVGLPRYLAQFDQDVDIRAILIRGAGPRGFCAGADVKESRDDETALQAYSRLSLGAWSEAVAATRKPLIAALHGACLGGGMELALACDIRIAAPDLRMSLPEVKLGLIPGGGGTQRLVNHVGLGRALDLLLTGDFVSAEEAFRIGLVSRVASSSDTLGNEAMALATLISTRPLTAVMFAKEAALAAAEVSTGLKLERALFSLLLTTEDCTEAAAAFREKRPAKFVGR